MTSPLLQGLLQDLTSEGQQLDELIAGLPARAWTTPTPAEGWTIAHQIAHLTWTDKLALSAVTDPHRFCAIKDSSRDTATEVDAAAATGAALPPGELLASWRASRSALALALATVPPGVSIPWMGPDMGGPSMATARLMETWAHGVDVRDALGRLTPANHRLRAIAHLGVRTRDFSFLQRSLPAPRSEFLVELTGPDGETWTWGPADAKQQVSGPALDFCLRVTRRRHRDDLALKAVGIDANKWLDIAQAFAGPPGHERPATVGPNF